MQRWLKLIALVLFFVNVDLVLYKYKMSHTPHVRPPVTQLPPSDNWSEPLPPDTQPDPVRPPNPVFPEFVDIPVYRKSEDGTVYGDIISHSKDSPFGDRAGRTTNAHETTHGINSHIRNASQKQGKRINGFYVLEGRGVVLEEPKIKMSNAVRFVPQKLRSYRWDLYMVKQLRDWNDTPTYICDEWVAYINGGACGVDDVKKGKHREGWTDAVSGCCDFSIYTIGLAMATAQDDPEYWKNYPQFRNFIIWELKNAERIFLEGRVMNQFKWKKQDDLLLALLESPEGQAMREFCRKELDGVWIGIDPSKIREIDYTGTPTEAELETTPITHGGYFKVQKPVR